MRVINWILFGCFLTSSFDLILIINLGGNFRASQILLLFVCMAAAARMVQQGRILWPRGATALLLWLFSQFLFLPESGVLSIGLQFLALLTFTIVGLLAVVQLYGDSRYMGTLFKLYLASFVCLAGFGLFQLALPLVGLPGILVQQWLVHGKIARINGFSYEPSYYATYLVMGWIMLIELRLSDAAIARGRFWKWAAIVVTAALFLSSSKTAWLFMLIELFVRILPSLLRGSRVGVSNFTRGRLVIRVPARRYVVYVALGLAVLSGALYGVTRFISAVTLLAGTGLAGTAAHSYTQRLEPAVATFETFREHPLIGRSLGGVPVHLAAMNGVTVHNMAETRVVWGFPVVLDVLAASGIIAFIPFLYFAYVNTIGALRLARRQRGTEQGKWLAALARAAIFEALFLLADQNILRVYLWYHLSMVMAVAYFVEFGPATKRVGVAAAAGHGRMATAPQL